MAREPAARPAAMDRAFLRLPGRAAARRAASQYDRRAVSDRRRRLAAAPLAPGAVAFRGAPLGFPDITQLGPGRSGTRAAAAPLRQRRLRAGRAAAADPEQDGGRG